MVDLGEDEEFAGNQGVEGAEGRDIDPDALAFIQAKRHVDDIQKAKKFEKRIGAHNWCEIINSYISYYPLFSN